MPHAEPRDIHLQSSQNARLGNRLSKARDANRQVQSPIARFGEWTAQARNQLRMCSQGSVLASAQARNSSLSSLVCAFCFALTISSSLRARESFASSPARPPARQPAPPPLGSRLQLRYVPGFSSPFLRPFQLFFFLIKLKILFVCFGYWSAGFGTLLSLVTLHVLLCYACARFFSVFFFFCFFPLFSFGLVLTDFIQSARRIGLPFFAVSFLPAVIRILSTLFRRIAGSVVLWFLEGEELFFPCPFLRRKELLLLLLLLLLFNAWRAYQSHDLLE